ncbi:MAG: hypothetical protein EBU90_01640 [Proteobacteria bacterium]|nr:hypothetical protein [Pseudomonadota bacterium]
MAFSAQILDFVILPIGESVGSTKVISIPSNSNDSPNTFKYNSNIYSTDTYPFQIKYSNTGGTNTHIKAEFYDARTGGTLLNTKVYVVADEQTATGKEFNLRVSVDDTKAFTALNFAGSVFIRITGCEAAGANSAAFTTYTIDGKDETRIEYKFKREKSIFLSTVKRNITFLSTLPKSKLFLSTISLNRIFLSVLDKPRLFFSTTKLNRLFYSTPNTFPDAITIPKARLSILNDSSLLRIEDDTTYGETKSRTDYRIYTVLLKDEETVAIRNSNNPDTSVLWEFSVSNGIYELFYIVIPEELNVTVRIGNAYLEVLKIAGVLYQKYTITVSKEILACLEELNDREIERLLENLYTDQNRYIQAESLYISMLVAASKNDIKTTKKLKEILEGLCINCGCGC